ncbi:MAG: hypothetical protein IPP27_02360 [Bacteroidetes bacterium]|nr:hypothetical protein [Bacteroidota bacterium]
MELEKPRITNNLEWKIDVDSDIDLEEVELPPLILQTFVENCVKHGINGIPRIGQIKIVCKKAEGRINITIEDNGTGVDLKYKNEGSQGLKLTRDRLAMFTKINNADASLEIHNLVSGTKVVISFNI